MRRTKGGRDWVKGQSGNPKGRPKCGIIELRRMNSTAATTIFNKYLWMSLEDLKEVAQDVKLPAYEHLIIHFLVEGIKKGDPVRLEVLLDRLNGKVPQKLEAQLTDDTRRQRLDLAQDVLKKILLDRKEESKEEYLAVGLLNANRPVLTKVK